MWRRKALCMGLKKKTFATDVANMYGLRIEKFVLDLSNFVPFCYQFILYNDDLKLYFNIYPKTYFLL